MYPFDLAYRRLLSLRFQVEVLAGDHPVRQLVERALAGRKSAGPVSVALGQSVPDSEQEPPEHLLLCHAIEDAHGRFLGAMVVARNLIKEAESLSHLDPYIPREEQKSYKAGATSPAKS